MIVRTEPSHFVCITQPDHAVVASRLIEAWCADGLPTRPTRPQVILATELHDVGWTDEDAAPRADPGTGAPIDFIAAPTEVRQSIWPNAVAGLSERDPYVAALVAQHALTIYRRFQHDPTWHAFFPGLEELRDDLYARAMEQAARDGLPQPTSFLQDYSLVGLGDLCSLVFCNGWHEPHLMEGYQAMLRDNVLTVTPDPFGGLAVPFEVPARRLKRRHYASDAELREAWAEAQVVTLTGIAIGDRSGAS